MTPTDNRWFHGIEHLTKDGTGYVYWKGHQVDHYSFHERQDEEAASARDLAARCLHLEGLGLQPTTTTAIWRWSWFSDLTREKLDSLPMFAVYLLTNNSSFWEAAEGGKFCFLTATNPYPGDDWRKIGTYHAFSGGQLSSFDVVSDEIGGYYHVLADLGWVTPKMEQGEFRGCCYATTAQVLAWFEKMGVMKQNG